MRYILTILIVLMMVACASAITIQWDMSDMNTVTGFKIYRGSATRTYDQTTIPVGLATCVGTNPTTCEYTYEVPNGKWYWAVTAVSTSVESDLSNEVYKQVVGSPKNAREKK